MSEELFTLPVTESPKLRWMREHRLQTRHDDKTGVWTAFDAEMVTPFRGETEELALAAWALARRVKLWNQD